MRDIRRTIRLGFLLVLLGLIAAAVSGSASGGATAASGNGPDPGLVQKLKDKARGSVALSEKQATKHIGFVRAGQNGDLLPGNSGKAEVKAKDFLREYGAILGAGSESTLDEISSTTDSLGATHVTYQQFYKDVPVWGGTIKAHTDADGNLTAVNGVAVPDISLDTTPRLSAADAGARAIATVVADPPANEKTGQKASLSASDLHVSSAKLYVYRLGLPKGAEGTNQLVYEVTVTNGSSVRDVVFVHAQRGQGRQPLLRGHRRAVPPRLYEQSSTTADQVWQEGDPFPGALNGDQQNIVNFSGNSYWHFFNAFGRDSYDGAGREMRIGQQRSDDRLPERQLERHDHELLQRRHLRRRRRARVGSRLHAVHARPDLPVAAGRAQRVLLGHLGRDGRPDQRGRHRRAGRGPHGRRLLDVHRALA